MPLPNWMVYTLYGNAMLDLTIFISPGSIAVPDLIEAKFKSPEGELKDLHCDMDFLEDVEEKAKQRYFLMVFIQVTGSQFRAHPPLVWYPPYPQKNRATASHMHAICSMSEPQPSTCNLFAAFESHTT
jgi:hypothetical protein